MEMTPPVFCPTPALVGVLVGQPTRFGPAVDSWARTFVMLKLSAWA